MQTDATDETNLTHNFAIENTSGEKTTTPICDFLNRYAASGTTRFHMPGHKGQLSPFDITEIQGADSLYEADGIIRESERTASRIFGSAATFYSTEGSSQCIRAMLALATKYALRNEYSETAHSKSSVTIGSSDITRTETPIKRMNASLILAARNVHRSFLTACALLDLTVEWLYPAAGDNSLYSCLITAEQLEQTLISMPCLPAAIYITSPDYLGNMQDIRALAQVAHTYDVPLLVDNAHGAYLHFLDTPAHPLDLGADLCCDSAHKTLPALTGCAYLHIGTCAPKQFADNAKKALAMFGSTSPSYLLLSSLDAVNAMLDGKFSEELSACITQTEQCKQELAKLGWKIPGMCEKAAETSLEASADRSLANSAICHHALGESYFEPLKITIHTSASGVSGISVADFLRHHGIEAEFSDPDFVVLMTSPGNTREDFNRLVKTFQEIDPEKEFAGQKDCSASGEGLGEEYHRLPMINADPDPCTDDAAKQKRHPSTGMSIREAAFAQSSIVPIEEAIGQICADTAITCPPAIPIVVCGEIITKEAAAVMQYYGITCIAIVDPKKEGFQAPSLD